MNQTLLEQAAVGISLPPAGTYVCKSWAFAEDMGQGTYAHVVELQFETDLESFHALLLTDEKDLVEYVNQKVAVSFRGEVFEGVNILRIQKLNILQVITTLDKVEGIKLYPDGVSESKSTVIFKAVTEDDPIYQGIVFVASATEHSSTRSNWIEYDIIDSNHTHARTRLFNPEANNGDPIADCYMECDLSFDPRYGFTSTFMKPRQDLEMYSDPTVAICTTYLQQIVSGLDPAFQKVVMESRLIDSLYQSAADINIFVAATACHLAQDFQNVSPVVNHSALVEAVLMQFLHTATVKENEFISDDLTSLLVLSKYNAMNQRRINAIDVSADKVYLESQLAKNLVETAKLIVETERKLNHGSKVVTCT